MAHGRALGEALPEGDGGAVLCDGASPRFESCVFLGNQAEYGGALASRGGRPQLADCVFRQNTAEHGGAVHAGAGGMDLDGCLFDNNASLDGGALQVAGAPVTARACRFTANLGYNGGAVHVAAGADLALEGCRFTRNFGTLGGGVYATGAGVRLDRCVLAANTGGSGGGLLMAREAQLVMVRTVVAFSPQGGALAVDTTSGLDVRCSLLYGNAEGDWTGVLADHLHRNGNLRADPRFRDPARGDFTFAPDSPCLAGRPGCEPMFAP
jgi:predicted outer membrane repeat protein